MGTRASLAPWDYLGALLVCTEAGARVAELDGDELVTTDLSARRAVVAAAGDDLLDELRAASVAARAGPGR